LPNIKRSDVPRKMSKKAKNKAMQCFDNHGPRKLRWNANRKFSNCISKVFIANPSRKACRLLAGTMDNSLFLSEQCYLKLATKKQNPQVCDMLVMKEAYARCRAIFGMR